MNDDDFKRAWNWIRFGRRGDWIENGPRSIVRTSGVDTVFPACNCYENNTLVKTLYGREAVSWLLSKEDE